MEKNGLLLLLICHLFMSCSFESEGVYTDDRTEEYELYDYYIDSYGNEGIVAWVDLTGPIHEIIVISADESYESWGPMGNCVYKVDSISPTIFTQPEFGVAMHQSMKSIGVESFPAQAWCDKKNYNEEHSRAGSWRLPTLYELRRIFGEDGSRVNMLNKALYGIGAQTIGDDMIYWTCVEDHDDYVDIKDAYSDYDKENRAVIVSPHISTYSYKDRWLKKNKYKVRAIKYIYYYYE